MDATIQKTNEKMHRTFGSLLSNDKETLRMYHLREMGMSDYTTAINTAMEKGEAKGIEKGKQEDIRNLLDFGMPPQQVSAALKAPLSMVDRIQEETRNSGG
ncbi:hypothetical protein AGMMS4952_21010 [Spirochaetia bacterium]|nr:hypothetical protein AGMMS4952_21010 [Spirochaetia bacterium]